MEELDIKVNRDKKPYIWVEKYRPTKLEDYVGNGSIKSTFKSFVEKQDFCHLFLYGGPGTGKTTLAKMLVKSVECDFIYINASDENGVDVIRDKIKNFCNSSGFKPLKVVIFDEADYLSQAAQASLRPVMEIYSLRSRFILTGNYHERIIEPISSRCQSFELIPPSKKEVAIHVMNILKNENVSFTNETLATVINSYYPDIRKVIQVCQQYSLDGTLKLSQEELISSNIQNKLLDLFVRKSPFSEIRKFIVEQDIRKFEEIYDFLYENVDKFSDGKQASVILKLADGCRDNNNTVNKQIIFLAIAIEILKILKS
jgi:DNA polymerase III delta prime subunit